MKRMALCAALAAAIGLGLGMPLARADTFRCHGTLQDAGEAVNGTCELRLTLYSGASGGRVLAGPATVYDVEVSDGNFITSVDFGPLALCSQAWLAVEVKAGNPIGSYLGTAVSQYVHIKANAGEVQRFFPNSSVGLAYPYTTAGACSTAIGYNGRTVNAGSIVTGGRNDTMFGSSIRDSATNQVILVAEHGVGINTAKAPDGHALRDELTIAPSAGLPAGNADLTFESSTTGNCNGFNMSASPGGLHLERPVQLGRHTLV